MKNRTIAILQDSMRAVRWKVLLSISPKVRISFKSASFTQGDL